MVRYFAFIFLFFCRAGASAQQSSAEVGNDLCQETAAVWVPDCFTPNNDRLNDEFVPVLSRLRHFELRVFDDKGQLIYRGTDESNGWDGSYRGQSCPEMTYFWKLSVADADGGSLLMQGKVLLLRLQNL